ncbi:glycosyltransferase family 59 protein [Xylariaceae sp. FL1651]|nr:glycosyltransferase family 59 protein [Xylariaceae sp. FL1651]
MMGITTTSVDSLLVSSLICCIFLYSIAYLWPKSSEYRGPLHYVTAALFIVTPLAHFWLQAVTENVPNPYLDEIFHIPQAQVYCEGRYGEWDDKITTPPGLYVLTILFNGFRRLSCSVLDLRAFNVNIPAGISVVALICRANLHHTFSPQEGYRQRSLHAMETGINIALFPVLFFFSGLYYTDPMSTLVVLLAYVIHLTRVGSKGPSLLNDVSSLGISILALGMRQTNIFWVVVYMGGLEIIHSIKALRPHPVETPDFKSLSEQLRFYAWRYSLGDIHDPPVALAYPIDIALCVISIGVATIYNLPVVFRRFVWPHGVVLATFIAFVAWNGGVVLGDKSNHVATLHLAQMLYIWPLFAFFSAPLFIPRLFNLIIRAYQALTSPYVPRKEKELIEKYAQKRSSASEQTTALQVFNWVGSSHLAHSILICVATLTVAIFIVRFNTIIHPFTLADNRHYMFYVFRYSILRAWWIRYALVPIYVGCAWMCWAALQGSTTPSPAFDRGLQRMWIQSPFSAASQASSPATPIEKKKASIVEQYSYMAGSASSSPPTSTVLMLLLATALSLMTAPLVEPRYFILPWVFWRLLVPAYTPTPPLLSRIETIQTTSAQSQTEASNTGSIRSDNSKSKWRGLLSGESFDFTLILETAWFLLINVATMYVFLTRSFYWRAPDGTLLDEGRVQRFMW